jgi:hypothetical protein
MVTLYGIVQDKILHTTMALRHNLKRVHGHITITLTIVNLIYVGKIDIPLIMFQLYLSCYEAIHSVMATQQSLYSANCPVTRNPSFVNLCELLKQFRI